MLGHEHGVAREAQGVDDEVADQAAVFGEENGLVAAGGLGLGCLGFGRVVGIGNAGEVDLDRSSASGLAVDGDVTATLLDDAVADGKAQARPLPEGLGREEGFEDAVENLLGHSGSGVGDRDKNVLSGDGADARPAIGLIEDGVAGLDRERSAMRSRVAGVHGEVHDDLLELRRIGGDAAGVGREKRAELEVLADEAADEGLEVGDDLAGTDRAGIGGLLACEGQELAGEAGSAIRGFLDVGERLAGGMSRLELAQCKLEVVEHRHEHVVEVVGDASREASDPLHFLGMQQLRFEPLAFGDVTEDDGVEPAVADGGLGNRGLDRELRPVRARR